MVVLGKNLSVDKSCVLGFAHKGSVSTWCGGKDGGGRGKEGGGGGEEWELNSLLSCLPHLRFLVVWEKLKLN